MQTRTKSLVSAAFVVLTLALCFNTQAAPPNIILLMGDDHGWDETGYNGHPHVKTPVLDEMAAQGLRFDNFYSAHPSCSPTRGSIITGRHPNRYGTFTPNWSMRPEEIGIAALLGKAGYTSGHFGKWHLGPVKKDSPTNPGAYGFDTWLSHDNFFEMNPSLSRDGAPPQVFEGEGSKVIVDEAIKFINGAKKSEKPFFTVLWFGSPHEPYSGLKKDLALYEDLPEEWAQKTTRLTSNETGRSVERPLDEVLQERYAEITAMDRAIGELRDYLKAEGLKENTLLWYCGDNGTPGDGIITSPFRGAKGNVYEGGIRVPGVVEWPAGVEEPMVTKLNAVTTDMLPTLCALAGVELPERPLDGIDLTPLIESRTDERPAPIYFWGYDTSGEPQEDAEPYIDPDLQVGTTPLVKLMGDKPIRVFRNFTHPEIRESDYAGELAVVDNRYKLVVMGGRNEEKRRQLFDLRNDPNESEDIYEENKDIAEEMERDMRDWQRSVLQSLTGADYEGEK